MSLPSRPIPRSLALAAALVLSGCASVSGPGTNGPAAASRPGTPAGAAEPPAVWLAARTDIGAPSPYPAPSSNPALDADLVHLLLAIALVPSVESAGAGHPSSGPWPRFTRAGSAGVAAALKRGATLQKAVAAGKAARTLKDLTTVAGLLDALLLAIDAADPDPAPAASP